MSREVRSANVRLVVALLTGGITSMTASAMIGGMSWFRRFALMAVPYYVRLVLGGIVLRLMVGIAVPYWGLLGLPLPSR